MTVPDRPLRLLWVNHFSVAPTEAGGTRHLEMARALSALGWDVTIVASDFNLHGRVFTRRSAGDRRTVRESVDGVAIRWLYATPYRQNDGRRLLNWLSFAHRLGREDWGDWEPDVIIGSSPHLFAAWGAHRVASRLRKPFVLEVRDLWPESLLAAGRRRPSLGYHALGMLAGALYRRSERIIVLARGAGDYLRGRGVPPSKLVLIPNGADGAAFGTVTRPARTGLTLVYAGAHGPANGLGAVLEAARLLRGTPSIRFLLVGDGPSKAELRETATRQGLPNVEFRAPVPKMQMPALLAEGDAGLMVLREAPLFAFGVSPNKLFDYLAAAMPVVSNVPGEVAELLRAAGAGVQAGDSSGAALAEAIRRLAAMPPGERASLGVRGRIWVTAEHSRSILAARLDSALRELLHR